LFVGRPPFALADVTLLTDHISYAPIAWPKAISPVLKEFLSSLLTRPVSSRINWHDLRRHPFLTPPKHQP
jgi:hypothetical protein